MKGLVVYNDGSVAIKEMAKPSFGPYQALVKMQSGGLCGTDLKILHNKLKYFEDYPTILGHEGVAEVVEVGEKVKSFKKGDRIVLPYIFEKIDEFYASWGAFAEYAIIGDTNALYEDGHEVDNEIFYDFYHAQRKIPKEIDPIEACMIVTYREVYAAVKRLKFEKNKNIVIYGAGPVGLVYITFAKMLGLGPIISVDIRDDKNKLALEAGADIAINSTKKDVVEEVKALLPEGADITIDAAGVPQLINTSLRFIKDGGDIVVYGVTPKNEATINWDLAPYNWNLKFIQWPSKMEEAAVHDEIIDMILEGKLKGMDYISDIYDFKDMVEAVKFFESGKMQKKIAIKF